MVSEKVVLDASDALYDPKLYGLLYAQVSASFTMQNQGSSPELMQVLFPLTYLDDPETRFTYIIVEGSFKVQVDGQPVDTTQVSIPIEPIPGKIGPNWFVNWAGFDVTFPPGRIVSVQVNYTMRGLRYTNQYQGFVYILETGAGWYGTIGKAEISVKLPYQPNNENTNLLSPGYRFYENEILWELNDFEPARKDNIYVSFADPRRWSDILALRSRVKEYPQDADAWGRLATDYDALAVWDDRHILSSGIMDLNIYNLATQAYQRALELEPLWGDLHGAFAWLIWVRCWTARGDRDKLSIHDSCVQQVLREINLAISNGYTLDENNESRADRTLFEMQFGVDGFTFTPPLTPTPGPTRHIIKPLPTLTPVPTLTLDPRIPSQTPTQTEEPTLAMPGRPTWNPVETLTEIIEIFQTSTGTETETATASQTLSPVSKTASPGPIETFTPSPVQQGDPPDSFLLAGIIIMVGVIGGLGIWIRRKRVGNSSK